MNWCLDEKTPSTMVRYLLFIGHTFKSKFLRPDYTCPENKRDLMIDHINHCAISSVIRGANMLKNFLSLCQKKISEKKSHNLKNIIKMTNLKKDFILNMTNLHFKGFKFLEIFLESEKSFLEIQKSYEKKTFKYSNACHLFSELIAPWCHIRHTSTSSL